MKTRFLSVFLVLCLLCSMLVVPVNAATVASGKCGDNVSWVLSDSGTLTISGNGLMYNFSDKESPWYSYRTKIKTAVLKEGVANIGFSAFEDCINMTSITIPKSVRYLGIGSFENCSNLINIYISDIRLLVTQSTILKSNPMDGNKLPKNLYLNGKLVKDLVITNDVTYIGDFAFRYCDSLESVVIPEGVTQIGANSFAECSNLKSITIPSSLSYVGSFAFADSNNISELHISDLTAWLNLEFDVGGANPLASSGGGDVYLNGKLVTDLIVPGDITTIKTMSFYGWDSLKSVTIQKGVTTIGVGALSNCNSLEKVTIPNTVTTIEPFAFELSDNLKSVTIPSSVATIGDGAFQASGLTSFIMPNTVKNWGDYVFADCYDLTKITLPGNLTEINDTMFARCTSLKSVTIPDSVTKIGSDAFTACHSLESINIPEGVTSIGSSAFWNCNSLPSITIPSSVTSIANSAFSWCENLSAIHFTGDAPAIGENAFERVSGTAYYPAGNKTWTKSVMQDYGGSISWKSYNPPVRITKQPVDVYAASGDTAKVTVKATGDGLTYKWYFKDVGSSKFSLTTSFTGNSYSIAMDSSRDGRQVYCVVTDKYGNSVTSNTVTLSMAKATVKITQQPVSVTVIEGKTAKVTVKATGDGLTYKWYYKNPGDSGFTYTSSFKGNTYSVTMNEARNGRQVLCRVYDKYGNVAQTNTVKLSMAKNVVKITQQPKSVTVAPGAIAKVTVKATGDGLSYRWYYKNPGDSGYTYTSSYTGSSYSVTMNAARDGRQVLCRVYDKYGNMVQTNTVKLSMEHYVKITQQPVSITVAEGATAKVIVKATGDGLTYRWYYKNPGASSYTYTASYTGSTYSVTMNAARNGRQVLCRVYDKYGNVVQTNTVALKMK